MARPKKLKVAQEDRLALLTKDVELQEGYELATPVSVGGTIADNFKIPRNYPLDRRAVFAFEETMVHKSKAVGITFGLALGALVTAYLKSQGKNVTTSTDKGYFGVTEELAVTLFGEEAGKAAWKELLKIGKFVVQNDAEEDE